MIVETNFVRLLPAAMMKGAAYIILVGRMTPRISSGSERARELVGGWIRVSERRLLGVDFQKNAHRRSV